ncbi:MAG: glutamine synthetase III [Deltaproteobacteria bacterium]|nr:glutamine synthetase III [Deltaproteobacteria bacterium]
MSGNESRVQAIHQITNRKPMAVKKTQKLSKIWATDVFNLATMEEALSKHAYKAMKKTVSTGTPLDPATADVVAAAMKDWAISKGAKYFSHIFYPLTHATAEKHDGFIITNSEGAAITEFTGSLLIKGEPDGSSFPNGSIRMTNAARGYTAWDPSSSAYIMQTDNGATLMIPCVFMSWTGEALDKKIPLLRSNEAMNRSAQKVLSLMGETEIAPLSSSCGAEQEYFLVDTNFTNSRPDLLLAGRTLFGAASAKGQQFDDHYFGAIPARVQVYMQDVEDQLYRLGIPAKTRHNEVAPGQFEIAPYFEAANIAADHQQMLMTILKSTAKKHGFMCLLHEKPFAGINGSGKHVNWSVGNATQGNLLDPAPPAILSVYLGDQLEKVYQDIKDGNLTKSEDGGEMDLGLDQILNFKRDPGDRNRTSPFAFTGNRFEFRAVGSAQSVTGPLIAMKLQELMNEHGNAVFGGDGYSEDWHKMAVEERGLKNIPTTADALPALQEASVKELFEHTGVLSPVELESRYEVYAEQYILSIEVEAKLVIDMAKTSIYPAAVRYLSELAMTSSSMAEMNIEMENSTAKAVATQANDMMAAVAKLGAAMDKEGFASAEEHMQFCAKEIRSLMDEVRAHADALEAEVADELWPLPKYYEMLFIK